MTEGNEEIYTVELNLDDDPLSAYSWHISPYQDTIEMNLSHAIRKQKTDRWVFVGLANSHEEAHKITDGLRLLIEKELNCEKHFK